MYASRRVPATGASVPRSMSCSTPARERGYILEEVRATTSKDELKDS